MERKIINMRFMISPFFLPGFWIAFSVTRITSTGPSRVFIVHCNLRLNLLICFYKEKWFWFSSMCIFAYLKLSGQIIFGSISHKWLSIFSSFNALTQWCVSVRIAFLSFQSSFSLPWSLISLRWSLDSSVLVR